jgi:hypothetical protein
MSTRNSQHCHLKISCSINPGTIIYLICSSPHSAAVGKNDAPMTLILSDQCFPPYLEQEGPG